MVLRGKWKKLGLLALTGALAVGMMVICYMTAAFTHDSFWVTCALMLISGVPLPAFNSSIVAYINASTPVDMIGRVHSAQGIPNTGLKACVSVCLAMKIKRGWRIFRSMAFRNILRRAHPKRPFHSAKRVSSVAMPAAIGG